MIRRMMGVVVVMIGLMSGAWAQNSAQKAEMDAAFKEADTVKQVGPVEVKMVDQAVLKLPAGYVFIPMPAAGRVMKAMGNGADSDLLGLIFPDNDNWLIVARYEKAGYIRDGDAKDWNADDLLKSLREGTEANNEGRRNAGFPELEVVGWAEKPGYDAATHRLVWSAAARRKGDTSGSEGVNYNTYVLGREGYVSMNLITSMDRVASHKPVAHTMLSALEFISGKRYEDFNASTDKVAEYGLAALVAGVAAKKLGFFALAAAFLLKFYKIAIIAVIGGGAVIAKVFKRKDKKSDEPPPVA